MPQEESNRNVGIQEPTSISDVQQKPGHLLHEASHHSKSRVTKDPPCSLRGPLPLSSESAGKAQLIAFPL